MTPPARREVIHFRLFVAATSVVLLAFVVVFRDRGGALGAIVLVAAAYAAGLIAYLIVASLGVRPPGRRRFDR